MIVVIYPLTYSSPPESAFMAADRETPMHEFVKVDYVSRNFLVTVMNQEDQRHAYRHTPFDYGAFLDRALAYLAGEEDTSGSTIYQQLAKNLYLSEEETWQRKALEAVIAHDLFWTLSRKRVLELYINYAQFGRALYGICAASWYYFNHSPRELELEQAAELVGLIPSPTHVRRAAGPQGGLDFAPFLQAAQRPQDHNSHESFATRNNAVGKVYGWFENNGRYQPVWDIGVEGFAHDQPPGRHDCSTMPSSVRERLVAEGYDF
jgi:monofunctional biosynthetic peptidoglycan transglycosylase